MLNASKLDAQRLEASRLKGSTPDATTATRSATAATASAATRMEASTCHETGCKYMQRLDAKTWLRSARLSMQRIWTRLLSLVTGCWCRHETGFKEIACYDMGCHYVLRALMQGG